MLTKRQKQILDFVTTYTKKHDFAPTHEEIKKRLKLRSVSNIHQHIEALRNKGYLDKIKNQPRGIEILKSEKLIKIPIVGTIAAGQPIEAIEVPTETITVTKNEGFSIDIVLNEGENSIYAISENSGGKSSLPSSTLLIVYDNLPPELEINFPADNTNFSGKNQKNITLEGKTEPESQVYVAGHLVILDGESKFSYQISLNEGENKIKIEVFDKAGNKTEKEITVFYSPN